MMSQYSKALPNSSLLDKHRVLFAGAAAVILHSVLLFLSPFSLHDSDWSKNIKSVVSLSLQLDKAGPAEPVQESTQIPVVGPKNVPRDTLLPSIPVQEDNQHADPQPKMQISAATLQKWSKLETERLLSENKEALQNFSSTFNESTPVGQREQVHFKNVYGETHVVTKVGDKRVCYMQGSQFTQDDWVQGLVMFYDCGETEKFKLEIP